MAMSNSSPAMMRGAYSSQMAQGTQSGGQGLTVSDSSQIQTHPQRNTAFLCKVGCETVQEIVMRTNEVFTHLKNVPDEAHDVRERKPASSSILTSNGPKATNGRQGAHMEGEMKPLWLPNGTPQGAQMSNEKKLRIQENLNAIQRHFKPLRAIYGRVNDDCAGMEYTHIESLIPYKDEDTRADHKKVGENYRHLMEESRELKEQLYLKARYMKEIIDQLRKIIWEVNTMLAMSNT